MSKEDNSGNIIDKYIADLSVQDEKTLKILYQQKLNMQQELKKYKNFSDRFVVITDTVENIFKIVNKERPLSYSEYRSLRYLLLDESATTISKLLKRRKKVKRWKRSSLQ